VAREKSPLVAAGHVCGACGRPRYHAAGCACATCTAVDPEGRPPITVDPALAALENIARGYGERGIEIEQLRRDCAALRDHVAELKQQLDDARTPAE
jgi:hypothetical protein